MAAQCEDPGAGGVERRVHCRYEGLAEVAERKVGSQQHLELSIATRLNSYPSKVCFVELHRIRTLRAYTFLPKNPPPSEE